MKGTETMLTETQLNTNELIGELTDRIAGIVAEETMLLEFNNAPRQGDDTERRAAHETQIARCIHLVLRNMPLLEAITKAKEAGELRFLDSRPFTIAVYRLKAAILQGHAACGKLRMADETTVQEYDA